MKTLLLYFFLAIFLLLMRCNYPFEPVVEEDDTRTICVIIESE